VDTASLLVFISLGVLTLVPALFVVNSRSIVHAGFWLLPCFLGVAGLYAALEAHFFFVTQLLIYAGAILVLVLFALMLTRNAMNPTESQSNRLKPVAALVCTAFAAGSAFILVKHPWAITTDTPKPAGLQTEALGNALIQNYAVPFEVASLLLLAALIGAIVLAKSDRGPVAEPAPLADLNSGTAGGE
jgi:NADH-quinone oxidoreductase subunit J